MSVVTLINAVKINSESLDNFNVVSYFLSNISEKVTLKNIY